jgi:hypothetical protein
MLDFDLGFAKRLELGQQSIFLYLLRFIARRSGSWTWRPLAWARSF